MMDMRYLFSTCKKFNEDISAWDVGRAESLENMFSAGSSSTNGMFLGATAFDQAANAPWYT